MLSYHNPIYQDDLTLSVDNVVLDFYLSNPTARDHLMKLMDVLPIKYPVEVVHWTSLKPGRFREQFSIREDSGTSFWIGAALNGTSTKWGRCRMDFNPNKVSNHIALQPMIQFFLTNTHPIQRKVSRFDLAVDIPIERYDCFLIKDSRMYIERRHGQEFTQYLGAKSSAVGRVKLYNKQVESDLPEPLTRLEITLDPETPFEKIRFPNVYFMDTPQICVDGKKVTDTERFILEALLQRCGALNDLGRKTRVKMEALMKNYLRHVDITPENYAAILEQLQVYVGGNDSSS